jgi:hypothetical protein
MCRPARYVLHLPSCYSRSCGSPSFVAASSLGERGRGMGKLGRSEFPMLLHFRRNLNRPCIGGITRGAAARSLHRPIARRRESEIESIAALGPSKHSEAGMVRWERRPASTLCEGKVECPVTIRRVTRKRGLAQPHRAPLAGRTLSGFPS